MVVTVWQLGDSERFNTHDISGTQKPVVSVNDVFGCFGFFCALRFSTYPSQGWLFLI